MSGGRNVKLRNIVITKYRDRSYGISWLHPTENPVRSEETLPRDFACIPAVPSPAGVKGNVPIFGTGLALNKSIRGTIPSKTFQEIEK